MNDLKLELQKEAYQTLTDAEALALLPAQVDKIGRIQNDNKLDLLTLVITNSLTNRLGASQSVPDEVLFVAPFNLSVEQAGQYREAARILKEAFTPEYILSDIYRINLGLTDIRTVFDGGLAFGLITPEEHTKLVELATYKDGIDFTVYNEADVALVRAEIASEVEEVLNLPNSTAQQIYTLSIASTPLKSTTVKIMQRFGSDINDLTEWHQVGQFSNVKYKQQVYKAQVGACSAPYRELKVVSEYLLDMSVS